MLIASKRNAWLITPPQHASPPTASSVYPIQQSQSNSRVPISTAGNGQSLWLRKTLVAARLILQNDVIFTVDEVAVNPVGVDPQANLPLRNGFRGSKTSDRYQ